MRDITIVLIALVLAFVIVSPSLFSGVGQLIDRLGNWIKYGWDSEEISGNKTSADNSMSGYGSVGLKIYYANGKIQEYKPETFTVLPLIISDNNGEITKFEVSAHATIEHNIPSMAEYSVIVTNFDMFIQKAYDNIEVLVENQEKTDTARGYWTSGTAQTIVLGTWTAQDLENKLQSHGSGTYAVKIIFNITVKIVRATGEVYSRGCNAQTRWAFNYEKTGISSLTVEIGTYKFRS